MSRSLTRSLLLVSALLAGLAVSSTAHAATLPGNFVVQVVHRNFAWGQFSKNPNEFARVNLPTGKRHNFTKPAGFKYLQMGPGSDTAIAAIGYNGYFNGQYEGSHQLLRYSVDGGYQVLESLPAPESICSPYIQPISIERDGTVLALTRGLKYVGNYECALDLETTHLRRYLPGSAGVEEVWLPATYRPWLGEGYMAANGSTFAIATSATNSHPGAVVVLDTARQKILARRAIGRIYDLSLANPHSLYISQDGHRTNGKLMHWRIGNPAPRVLYRGKFSYTNNCGNRALLVRGNTLKLLTPKGTTVLTRRISEENFFASMICSGNYLHFLDHARDGDYYGGGSFVRHLANTSKLPR